MAKTQSSSINPADHLFSMTFDENVGQLFDVAFLVPTLNEIDMTRHYMTPLGALDLNILSRVIGISLYKDKKTARVDAKAYLDYVLPQLQGLGIKYLMVADAEYFRILSGNQSAEANLGHVLDSPDAWPGFKIIYCPNYRLAFTAPDKTTTQVTQALHTLISHIRGKYHTPGKSIVHFEAYPKTLKEITSWLQKLFDTNCDLTADIEGFSLKHYDAGLGSISFAWSQHEGIAFAVDLTPTGEDPEELRAILRAFFEAWAERAKRLHAQDRTAPRMIWHHAGFDLTVLIYQLFMSDILDQEGLLHGLDVMTASFEDTKIIAYLATNSCAGNTLGLKEQSQEFTGKYAIDDITNIRAVPLPKLLRYNLMDTLGTWFVYNKHYHRMIEDEQLHVYNTLFKPSLIDIIQMQLTGLPLNMDQVNLIEVVLKAIQTYALSEMQTVPMLSFFEFEMRKKAAEKYNATHVKKTKDPADYADPALKSYIAFNPGSPIQLQEFLYDKNWLHLPVLGTSNSGAASTKGDLLDRLQFHTNDPMAKRFLEALTNYKAVAKILQDFIPKFQAAPLGPDGWHWLFGFFNIGGTKSGRLSSSGPNLQNLPSNVVMAISQAFLDLLDDEMRAFVQPFIKKGNLLLGKLIKSAFEAPPGKLLVGLDFASLEDRISALQTRDPAKLRVYTDGYDSHCLRAYYYFEEEMPDIDPNSVESINSIASRYKSLRQDSKTPTFLLTYEGTHFGIVEQVGWDLEKAKKVEAKYNELYAVSKQWVEDRREEAGQLGYAVLAFGLRLRTPVLQQVVMGNRKTPYEARQEGRTMGNALGQSWGLLNNRASVEFMGKVRADPKMRLIIRQSAHIHDAQYFVIDEDMAAILFMNEHLVRAVEWQEDPLIYHPKVKLGGEVSIFYPNWSEELTIPNGATQAEIEKLASDHISDLATA